MFLLHTWEERPRRRSYLPKGSEPEAEHKTDFISLDPETKIFFTRPGKE